MSKHQGCILSLDDAALLVYEMMILRRSLSLRIRLNEKRNNHDDHELERRVLLKQMKNVLLIKMNVYVMV